MPHELTLKNIDDEILRRLRFKASGRGVDLDTYIITLFKKALGIETENFNNEYHDLDYLAGTWTKEDAEIFAMTTENFNKIDEELWK
jgi:hypothetical protein